MARSPNPLRANNFHETKRRRSFSGAFEVSVDRAYFSRPLAWASMV